ncbi:E3 ubiquitin-protein ligase like [Verticillium longisporum]|nr:E3 ubiquitin-protein ligase like [Verticillium longisporum]KAG7145308.1 E3 ubiquitin-protein ligase like [Verticillium longisporum]
MFQSGISQNIRALCQQSTNYTVCAICMEVLEDEEMVRPLVCGHIFHSGCITCWFLRLHDTCPLCKARFVNEDEIARTGRTSRIQSCDNSSAQSGLRLSSTCPAVSCRTWPKVPCRTALNRHSVWTQCRRNVAGASGRQQLVTSAENRRRSALPTGPSAFGASGSARNTSTYNTTRLETPQQSFQRKYGELEARNSDLEYMFSFLRHGPETDVHVVLRRIRDGAGLKSLGNHIREGSLLLQLAHHGEVV